MGVKDFFKKFINEAFNPTTTKEEALENRQKLKEVYTKEIPNFYKEKAQDLVTGVRDLASFVGEGVEKGADSQNKATGELIDNMSGVAKDFSHIYKDIFTQQIPNVATGIAKAGTYFPRKFGETLGGAAFTFTPEFQMLVDEELLTPENLKEISPGTAKSPKQVIGEAVGTAAMVAAPAGKSASLAGAALKGAAGGGVLGGAGAAVEDKGAKEIATGAAVGAVLGAGLNATAYGVSQLGNKAKMPQLTEYAKYKEPVLDKSGKTIGEIPRHDIASQISSDKTLVQRWDKLTGQEKSLILELRKQGGAPDILKDPSKLHQAATDLLRSAKIPAATKTINVAKELLKQGTKVVSAGVIGKEAQAGTILEEKAKLYEQETGEKYKPGGVKKAVETLRGEKKTQETRDTKEKIVESNVFQAADKTFNIIGKTLEGVTAPVLEKLFMEDDALFKKVSKVLDQIGSVPEKVVKETIEALVKPFIK